MNAINIADRKIGLDFKSIIICEISINHNGSLVIAKKNSVAIMNLVVEVL